MNEITAMGKKAKVETTLLAFATGHGNCFQKVAANIIPYGLLATFFTDPGEAILILNPGRLLFTLPI
jgi:hypothetical protein